MKNVFSQSFGPDLVNINVYAKVYQNIPHSLRDRAIITFSEFGTRQSLDQWKMSFRNPLGQILSISMFTQKFIKTFHSVYEIGPFSLFQNLALGKASTNDKCHFGIPCNINVSAKFYQNIPNDLRVKFHCFQNLNLGKTSSNPKCHLTISWATSCQYQCVCEISSQYSNQFKRYGHFHFFRIWSLAKPRPIKKMSFRNLLG